jgi:hypothetical protein
MRKLSATEKAALAFAVALTAGGVFLVCNPAEGVFFPPSNSKVPLVIRSQPERVSQTESRIAGGLAILSGVAFCVLVFYRGQE